MPTEEHSLISEIETEIRHCAKWAKHNYNWAQVIFILSVLSSFSAAILVGVDPENWTSIGLSKIEGHLLLALLTGMPASLLLINNTLRFEEKAKWCWKKCRKSERLLRQLRLDPNANVVTLGLEFSTISEEMESEWPAFGATPSQPKKPGI